MAITVTHRGTDSTSIVGDTNWNVDTASDFTNGSFGVILIGFRTSGGHTVSSVTDSVGNTWTSRTSIANGEYKLNFFTCNTISSLTTSDTLTISFTGDTTSAGCFVYELTAGGTVQYEDASSTTFASNGTITSGTIENGNVIFGFNTRASNIAPTADSDTTNGNWSTQIGRATGFTTYISSQYKIVNADGSQTYNITTGVAGVIGYVELTESVSSSSILDPFGMLGIFGI